MKNLRICLFILVLFGCSSPQTNEIKLENRPDTSTTVSVDSFYFDESEVVEGKLGYKEFFPDSDSVKIKVKNPSDYSEKFIQGLKELPFHNIELRDSLFILAEFDYTHFPKTPKIGRPIILRGKRDSLSITLNLKRINYTTIDYSFEILELGNLSIKQSGKADIHSGFFIGEESEESEISGLIYSVTEFINDQDNNCFTIINLGYEEESGPLLLGSLYLNCPGDNSNNVAEKFHLIEIQNP